MKFTKDTIGVGFIGAGDISILHAAAVKKCPGAKLVGLWNRNQDRANERAAQFGCKNYSTPDALVNDPAIDAVFVLTNLETHLEYTALALGSGKHRPWKKPVGMSVAEIERMKALADAKDLVCLPGHNYVYEQSMNRTRELVDGGDLGKIVSAYVMYNIHHPEDVAARYPGVVRQILTQNRLYILLYLVGKLVELKGDESDAALLLSTRRKTSRWCRCLHNVSAGRTSARVLPPTITRPTRGQ